MGQINTPYSCLPLLYTSVYAFVHHRVICESVSALLSAHLPSSLSVQRLPNSEHHAAEIRFINKSSMLRPAVPAAAGSMPSDLLNLLHFNHASTPLLSSHRSLAWIPKCPSAASSQAPLSTASCLELPPSQTDVALSYKERETEKEEKKHFNQWAEFF